MGEKRNAFRILVGISERKRPVGRPKRSERIILKWDFSIRRVSGLHKNVNTFMSLL
jgi:hypothetical protein